MIDVALSTAFLLGFLSGFKHAFEPDHVVAISTLVHQEARLTRALRMGLFWGAGHTTTLILGVLLIGLLRIQVTEAYLVYLEIPVALMLLVLGGWAAYVALTRLLTLVPDLKVIHLDSQKETVQVVTSELHEAGGVADLIRMLS